MTSLRNLPSVEQLLQTRAAAGLISLYGRPLTLEAIRTALAEVRKHARKDTGMALPGRDELLASAAALLEEWMHPTLVPVINASGVILHTNLGRAPLSAAAIAAIESVSHGYSNLEFDLSTGKRGSRLVHAEALLQHLTGAESAIVVNNNAGAVLLVLSALASRRRVLLARSQLVEIGGGFRIPDVMRQSGARLVEVGTTNKVRLSDYESALQEIIPEPQSESASGFPIRAVILRAHRSNFKMIGFTEDPSLQELVDVAHRFGVPCVEDLGSGTLLDTARYGLTHEPTIQESLAAGVDVVTFSGDKLLGGPQAGIILGKAHLLARIKKHPLARALRADKLCLSALTATLQHYLKDEAEGQVPIWRIMALTPEAIRRVAGDWARMLGQGEIIASESAVGGGSLPGETLPTFVLALKVKNPLRFMEKLRSGEPPIIARTEGDRILLDPRTVLPGQEGALLAALNHAGLKTSSR